MVRKADQTIVMVPAGAVMVSAGAVLVPVRGVRRPQAAAFYAISEATFQALVNAGILPPPVKIGAISVWDIRELDEAFNRLKEQAPGSDAEKEWD